MLKYRKYKLKNGTRVIIAPVKETRVVNIKIYAAVGSRYESFKNNGITHLIEHMFFKGTDKRPEDIVISREAENMGAVLNGSTSHHFCCLYASSLDEYFENCLEMLADMLHNSKFRQKNIATERGSIIEEIKMHNDNPQHRVTEMYNKLLYGGNPLAFPIAGDERTLREMKSEDLHGFVKKYFSARNIIISVAGRVKTDRAKKLIRTYFGKSAAGAENKYKPLCEAQKKQAIFVEQKNTQQANICIGVRSYNYDHPDYYALSLLSIILGGSDSSRLYTALRAKRGLVYFVNASNVSYKDTGNLLVQAGCAHEKALEVIGMILAELRILREKNVARDELKRVKNAIRSSMYMMLDSSEGIAEYLINEELTRGTIMTPEEKLAIVNKVTADDIRRVAGDIFKNSKLNIAMIGQMTEKKLKSSFKL